MFENFTLTTAELSHAQLRFRYGGSGPPVLLLHGHPRTHTTWWRIAPLLAARHSVVCPDLRGFGKSSKPKDTANHAGSSKRAKAADCIELMQKLGHDRGAYVAFRAALDHPGAISHLAVLDAVPILDALERCDARFAQAWWHWFFFAQPEKPERAILADPDAWYGGSVQAMGRQNHRDYRQVIHDPATVHAMIEDYRAGLGIDREHDAASRRASQRIQCPLLCLWAAQDDLADLYGDVLAVWRPWAADLCGSAIDCAHHMAEEAPNALAEHLLRFLAKQGASSGRTC